MSHNEKCMRYIFEKGQYPDETVIDDREFVSDNAARVHAETISADYVWDVPSGQERNPSSVYFRAKD